MMQVAQKLTRIVPLPMIFSQLRWSSNLQNRSFDFFKVNSPLPHVLHVELNRPNKANAMTLESWREMEEIFNGLNEDPAYRVAVISGAGKSFSTGIDLFSFNQLLESQIGYEPARIAMRIRKELKKIQQAFISVFKCDKPVICAIHGACVGGAVDLAAVTDIRYCSTDAWFQIKEVELGLAADVGTLQLFPRAVSSDSLARELIFTGRKFFSSEAARIGFVSRVFESNEMLLDGALKTAQRVAANSPVAVQTSKCSLNFSRDHTVEEGMRHIADLNQIMLQTKDIKEAISAALQKQKATFEDV